MSAEAGNLLVVGATGVAAQNLIDIVRERSGWSVTGLCRNPPSNAPAGVRFVSADLIDAGSCEKAVGDSRFSHIVYAARALHGEDGIEDVESNLAMLRNIVRACEGPALRHVHAVAGGKWYGMHIGPFRTPARESDPTHMPPNFYFDHQNFLIEESAKKNFTWSTSRPNIISGVTVGRGRNILSTIGAYAAICKRLNLAFDFPGKPGAYTSLQEMTDASLLARAIFWVSTTPSAQNEAYNFINGDLFRWENVWPVLAEHFGVKMGRVRHFSLVKWMADKGKLWDQIVAEHGLLPLPLNRVAGWDYTDFLLAWDYDVISSTTKARKAGFQDIVDTEEMMLAQLREYRSRKVLP